MPRGRVRRRGGGTRRSRRAVAEPDETEEFLRQAIATSARLGREGKVVKKRRVGGKLVTIDDGADESASVEDRTRGQSTTKSVDEDGTTKPVGEDGTTKPVGEDGTTKSVVEDGTTKSVVEDGTTQEINDSTHNVDAPALPQQVAYASSDESESDVDFEDVDIDANPLDPQLGSQPPSPQEAKELNIVLDAKDETKSRSTRRKGTAPQDRKQRLDLHKTHVLSLLMHVSVRNQWCNDPEIQARLAKILSKKTIAYLVDDETQTQFQRGRSFKEGMDAAVDQFQQHFIITERGMARSYWAASADAIANLEIPADIDFIKNKTEFRKHAAELEGSRDVGAQFFCAMLRGIGMEVRLVCSLQPLPISPTTRNPQHERNSISMLPHVETRTGLGGSSEVDSDTSPRSDCAKLFSRMTSGRIKRGSPSKRGDIAVRPGPSKKRVASESKFPIYWVEVFEPAYQRWTPVDPLVTATVAKPAKLEPPASDSQNNMSYVIAFEEDGFARDVTRRYAKAYNAKTRKLRVECTPDGDRWWKQVLRMYRRRLRRDHDQVEDAALAKKEASEEMPRNVADFKGHPYYALKRHLRKNEVIDPERPIGTVSTGRITADDNQESESIFRRSDVQLVKSADGWYRLGREVKPNAVPLKWAAPKRNKSRLPDDPEEEESVGAPLFSFQQTELYVPPPAVRGRIPRNRFGNLDIYCASMIPPGGVHVLHPDTSKAARILGIDYAEAVTGFEFRGRVGTAVTRGAIVAVQYLQAVVDVIHGLAYEVATEQAEKRSESALRMWARLLKALRIRERVQGYAIEGEEEGSEFADNEHASEEGSESDDHTSEPAEDGEDDAHDLLPDYATFLASQPPVQIEFSKAVAPPAPTRREQDHRSRPEQSQDSQPLTEPATSSAMDGGGDGGGGFLPESDTAQLGGGFLDSSARETGDVSGGGFLPDESDEPDVVNASKYPVQDDLEGSGGFLPEESGEYIDADAVDDSGQGKMEESGGFLPDASEPAQSTISGIPADAIRDKDASYETHDIKSEGDVVMSGHAAEDGKAEESEDVTTNLRSNGLDKHDSQNTPDESDTGSLLSHDPEDEDADPEWLIENIG